MLQVTEAAITKIKEELQNRSSDRKDPYIRLRFGFGWGGPRLQLALDESSNPSGKVIETNGIRFIISPDQSAFFENVTLDYKKSFLGFDEFKLVKA